jgi:hypothetical protein
MLLNPAGLAIPQIYPAGNGTGPRNYITQPGTFGSDGRAPAGTNPVATFNQYRTGVGYYNLTNVLPMRIMEVGLKFRF